jgi:hypothetical protein
MMLWERVTLAAVNVISVVVYFINATASCCSLVVLLCLNALAVRIVMVAPVRVTSFIQK